MKTPSLSGSALSSFWLVLAATLGAAMVIAPVLSKLLGPPPAPIPATAANVWNLLNEPASSFGGDPRFAYAIAFAESGLDPYAFDHGARGLMQMRWDAWETVSTESFREAWDWRKNTRAAVAYLALCRNFLIQHQVFSYGRLAACYHYGPNAVQDADFQLARLPRPRNHLYRQLFDGDPAPVAPPDAG